MALTKKQAKGTVVKKETTKPLTDKDLKKRKKETAKETTKEVTDNNNIGAFWVKQGENGLFLSGIITIPDVGVVNLMSFKSRTGWDIFEVPEAKEGAVRPKLEKVGCLFLRHGKDITFMSGYIEVDNDSRFNIVVFKNSFKEEEKHPDYRILPSNRDSDDIERNDDIPF